MGSKRFIQGSCGLALSLVLTLAACGGTGSQAGGKQQPGNGTTTPSGPVSSGNPPAASQSVNLQVPDGMGDDQVNASRKLMVPPGFAISVFARVPGARFMAVAPNGDILVSQPGTTYGSAAVVPGKVTLLRPQPGKAPQQFTFADNLDRPHDLVFDTIGGVTYLYVSEQGQIIRFRYTPGATSGGTPEVVVSGLPDTSSSELHGTYAHVLKNIAIDSQQKLYVSVASTGNANPADRTSAFERAAIYTYDATKLGQVAQDGKQLAHGIRNAEGLAFAPGTDNLWIVVNNRDQLPNPATGQVEPGYVQNHPPEEVIKVKAGADYGWPFCNPNPDTPAGLNNMPFERDVQNNADGSQLDCAKATPVDKGIQAHSAPLGVTFWTHGPGDYKNIMTTGLHGCWNCTTYVGYKVVFFPLNKDGTLGDEKDLVSGWLYDPNYKNTNNGTCADNHQCWGRPVDTADMPDGSLLISDDMSGTVYRLYKP